MLRDTQALTGATRTLESATLDASSLGAGDDEQVERLLRDLRLGLPIALVTHGRALLVAAVETLDDLRSHALASSGTAELVLTRRRVMALGARAPQGYEELRIPVPTDADRGWLAMLAGLEMTDPVHPHSTTHALEGGSSEQATAIALARAAWLLPAVVTAPLSSTDELRGVLTMDSEAAAQALTRLRPQTQVSVARLPTGVSETGRLHAFRPVGGGTEHFVVEVGTPDFDQPVLVRLHSACFTGDVLGSLKCDCGPQLQAAMAAMAEAGGGVLLYLNQEGRGIGLANKIRAYALQDAGLDTVEANHWLGFEDDQRDFRVGAQLLRGLGIQRVRLMTNNPAKMKRLASQGIEVVERIPLRAGASAHNAQYLATKAAKSGHLL